jgi:hypothetical protein
MDLKEILWEDVDWINRAQDIGEGVLINTVSGYIRYETSLA